MSTAVGTRGDAEGGRFLVRRHDAEYRVPAEHPDPAGLRRRLDRLAEGALVRVGREMLAGLFPPDDSSVWCIRSLDLDLLADPAAVDDHQLARAWARQVGHGLVRVLRRGPDGHTVLRFPSREAFLADAVRELAAGNARQRWHLRSFHDLAVLPPGAAVVEALTREEAREEADLAGVFRELVRGGGLGRVLSALGEGQADRLLRRALAGAPAGDPSRGLVEALTAGAEGGGPRLAGRLARGSRRAALELWARWVAGSGAGRVEPPGLALALDAACALGAGSAAAADPAGWLAATARGDLHAAAGLLRGGGAEAVIPLLPHLVRLAAGDADWLRARAGELGTTSAAVLREVTAEPGPSRSARPRSWAGDRAGVFLLLPSLLALDLPGLVARAGFGSPAEGSGGPARLPRLGLARLQLARLRLEILAACWGGERREASLTDPSMLLAAGMGAAGSREAGMNAAAGDEPFPETLGPALLEALPAHLAELGWIEGRLLAVDEARLAAGEGGDEERWVVLRDGARDHWPCLLPVRGTGAGRDGAEDLEARLSSRLIALAAAAGTRPRSVHVTPIHDFEAREGKFFAARRAAGIGRPPEEELLAARRGAGIGGSARAAPEGEAEREFLAARRPASDDLAFLTGGAPLGADPLHRAVILLARAVMRHFARRFMGFALASAGHLWTNFLAGRGSVLDTGDELRVELPAAPLAVVARMAGTHGKTFELPWGRPGQGAGEGSTPVRVTLLLPEAGS